MKKLLLILIAGSLFIGCSKNIQETPQQKQKIADAMKLAIDTIKEYDLVSDGSIKKNENDFSLALIVNESTNSIKAKELGESFVRQLKSLIPSSIEPNSSKDIGSGNYNYLIGVYGNITNNKICMGAKASSARKITW